MRNKIFISLLLILIISFLGSFSLYSQDDEFKELNEDEVVNSEDEFGEFKEFDESETDDEFGEFKEFDESEDTVAADCESTCQKNCSSSTKKDHTLAWILSILGFTALAGVLVRFKSTRNLRGLFLLTSLFVVGFYNGACTGCPVNGLQNFLIGIFGFEISWKDMLWFIAIIPLTYLFGRVYCGWICHLGALQEFIYLPGKLKWLRTNKARIIFKWTRIILTLALIIQIAIMGTRYWCKIDPFVNIFGFGNFFDFVINSDSFDIEFIILITLVLLILVSSVFTHRPFCRSMCPVGLLLGFVSRIPGASVIGLKADCVGCTNCYNSCKINAIIREDKVSILDNQDCIACGDCIDACTRKGLEFTRKSKQHKTIVNCENNCKTNN